MRSPGLIAGVIGLVLIAYITLNSIRTEGPGSRGVPAGEPLPAFAAPLAQSELEGDARVSEDACDLRGEDILNSCELAERGPVALVFFAEPIGRCTAQLDVVERVRERFPDVQFAAVAIRGDRDAVRERVQAAGWTLPVALDRDGAVTNLYAVTVCPAITYAAGGKVVETAFGSQSEAQLSEALEALR